MMFAPLIAAALVVAQEPPTVTRTVRVAGPTLDIPDEFAPAAVTYFACKVASRGGDLKTGTDGPSFNPDNVKPGDDCSTIRAVQIERAIQMLGSSKVARKKRRLLVERTFDQIDAFTTHTPGPAPQN